MKTIQNYIDENFLFIPSVVAYLMKEDQVLLGLRKHVQNNLGLNMISGIGGKIGDSEDIKDEKSDEAMKRELNEEIGIKVVEFEKMGRARFILPHKEKWSMEANIYLVTGWTKEIVESFETKPIWYNKNELPTQQMWEADTIFIPKVLNKEKIDAIFLYNEKLKVIEYTFE